jgi:hypothetical protein
MIVCFVADISKENGLSIAFLFYWVFNLFTINFYGVDEVVLYYIFAFFCFVLSWFVYNYVINTKNMTF